MSHQRICFSFILVLTFEKPAKLKCSKLTKNYNAKDNEKPKEISNKTILTDRISFYNFVVLIFIVGRDNRRKKTIQSNQIQSNRTRIRNQSFRLWLSINLSKEAFLHGPTSAFGFDAWSDKTIPTAGLAPELWKATLTAFDWIWRSSTIELEWQKNRKSKRNIDNW